MYKFFSLLILAPLFAVTLSCASSQSASQSAASAEKPPLTQQEIYEKYSDDIILEGAKTYTVVKGDSLAKITKNQYGSGNGYFFPLIMLASWETVSDPDLLVPEMKLTIPDLQRNLNDPKARQKIKEFLNDIADVYKDKPEKGWGEENREHLRNLAASL
jgi:hypothetical protein